MLGDSNSSGTGQTRGFHGGVMGRVSRSILNSCDRGFHLRKVEAYETLMEPYQVLTSKYGWTDSLEDGFAKGGACGNLVNMGNEHWIAALGRSSSTVKFAFHPVLSEGGRWQVSVGDKVVASGVADGAGSTGDIDVAVSGFGGAARRRIKFECVGGRILYQHGELFTRGKIDVPFVWCAPEGSQGFSDFATEERMSSIVPHVNARSGKTLIFISLGTNNFISAASKHRIPDEYVLELDACLRQWDAAVQGDKQFVLAIPPKPRVQLPYAPYETYVNKTLEYAKSNPWLSLIRTDMSILGTDSTQDLYSADGIHLNEKGHEAWAAVICQQLGVRLNDFRARLSA